MSTDYRSQVLDKALDEMEKLADEAMKARYEQIELFIAALAKEVGPDRIFNYELVEEWGENKIRWYFRRRV